MKKIFSIMVIAALFCVISIGCSGQEYSTNESMANEWSGSVRIEGKNSTIWNGIVTVTDTSFYARNIETNETLQYNISYPSPLGVVVEAANVGGFCIAIDYYPSLDSFIVKTINSDSDWWQCWIDYKFLTVGAGEYELCEKDNEILFGYVKKWPANALIIDVDKSEIKKDEIITVYVFDETNTSVADATVYVNSETYTTDDDGNVTITLSNKGKYTIYSEKDGFVRSDKIGVQVKKKSLIKNLEILRFNNLFEQFQKVIKNLKIYKMLVR